MTTREEATAAPVPVTLGGGEYRLSPMTDLDRAEWDLWARAKCAQDARDTLPEDASMEQRELTERIAQGRAARISLFSQEGLDILGTPDGFSRLIWLSLRKEHPDLDPDSVRELLTDPRNLDTAQREWERLNVPKAKGGPKKRSPKVGTARAKGKRKAARTSTRRNRKT